MSARGDIGIGGAGPAGARAAELFASMGANVLMLDPKGVPRGWLTRPFTSVTFAPGGR